MNDNLICDPNVISYKFDEINLLYNPISHEITCGNDNLINYWKSCQNKTSVKHENNKYQKLLIDNCFLHSHSYNIQNNLSNSLNSWLTSKLEIYQLYLIINRVCNFKCKYCRQFIKKSNSKSDVMSKKIAFDTVKSFLKQQTQIKKGIVFYGGEPALSFPLIIELIKYIREYSDEKTNGKEIEINIFTNGTLITQKTADFFAKHNIFIIISFDGLPKQNDSMRIFSDGRGTFKYIVNGIKTYQNAGCKVGISFTIGAHNISNLKESIDYIKTLKAINLGFNLPHDNEENPLRPKATSNDWIDKIINFFWNETKNGLYTEHIIRKLRLFVNKKIKICECPAVNGRIVVLPDGRIGLCEGAIGYDNFFLPEKSAWENLEYSVKEWKRKIPLFDTRCQKCPAIAICGGGCMLDGYFENGSLSNYNTVRCLFAQKIIKKFLSEIVNITKQKNSCWNISDNDRHKLWTMLVYNHEKKPLTTSVNFGEIYSADIKRTTRYVSAKTY